MSDAFPYPFDQGYTATVDAAGEARVPIDSGGQLSWLVTQVSIELATAPAGSTCSLRKNGKLVTPLVPTGDAASGDPPILLRPGEILAVEWTGCTPGDSADVFIVYSKIGYSS